MAGKICMILVLCNWSEFYRYNQKLPLLSGPRAKRFGLIFRLTTGLWAVL